MRIKFPHVRIVRNIMEFSNPNDTGLRMPLINKEVLKKKKKKKKKK